MHLLCRHAVLRRRPATSCGCLGALLLAAGARPISGMLRPADRAALRDGQTIVGPRTGTYLRVLALGVTDADLAPLWLFDTATGGMARVLGAALDGGSSSARSRSRVAASSAQLRALMGARLGMASFGSATPRQCKLCGPRSSSRRGQPQQQGRPQAGHRVRRAHPVVFPT